MKKTRQAKLWFGILLSFTFLISCQETPPSPVLPESALPIPTIVPTPVFTPFPPLKPVKVKLAWFYKPPADGDLFSVVNQYDFYILTKGDEDERDMIIGMGVQEPILQYIRFDAIQDPGLCDANPYRNQVAYNPGDFCTISRDHPDWFLLDQDGNRIISPDNGKLYFMMDPGNDGWRAFFLERLSQSQQDPNWGGVFLDNVEVTFKFRESRNQLPQRYTSEADYQAAVQDFLHYLSASYFKPQSKYLYANIVANNEASDFPKFITYLDGAMMESWAIRGSDGYRAPELWEEHMRLAEETQALGKEIILVSQGQQESLALQKFAFASYLLINNGRAVFRYAHSDFYNEVWLYDDYTLNLGQPLGSRYLDGGSWSRDFENGKVSVNPVSHKVEISLN